MFQGMWNKSNSNESSTFSEKNTATSNLSSQVYSDSSRVFGSILAKNDISGFYYPNTTTSGLYSGGGAYTVGISSLSTKKTSPLIAIKEIRKCMDCYDYEEAVAKCKDCDKLFCQLHTIHHIKSRLSRSHKLVVLDTNSPFYEEFCALTNQKKENSSLSKLENFQEEKRKIKKQFDELKEFETKKTKLSLDCSYYRADLNDAREKSYKFINNFTSELKGIISILEENLHVRVEDLYDESNNHIEKMEYKLEEINRNLKEQILYFKKAHEEITFSWDKDNSSLNHSIAESLLNYRKDLNPSNFKSPLEDFENNFKKTQKDMEEIKKIFSFMYVDKDTNI
jgi:hypothetical protein